MKPAITRTLNLRMHAHRYRHTVLPTGFSPNGNVCILLGWNRQINIGLQTWFMEWIFRGFDICVWFFIVFFHESIKQSLLIVFDGGHKFCVILSQFFFSFVTNKWVKYTLCPHTQARIDFTRIRSTYMYNFVLSNSTRLVYPNQFIFWIFISCAIYDSN